MRDAAKRLAYIKQWKKENPSKIRRYGRKYRKAHPERVAAYPSNINAKSHQRAYWLKRVYGITVEQYAAILASQGGVCALCGLPPRPENKNHSTNFHVDHDHLCCPSEKKTCGKCIRGLIHTRCNFMLGNAGDNPEILRKAAEYLEKKR